MPGSPLDKVSLHLVNNLHELDNCRRWLGSARPYLGVDTESAGLRPQHDRCRMIQLGDLSDGWAFPADGWGGAAAEMLRGYRGPVTMFNSPYDRQVLKTWHGVDLDPAQCHDGQLAGHVADNMRPDALKARAAIEVDPRAMLADQKLQQAMKEGHWDWATIPVTHPAYWVYAAADPVLAVYLQCAFEPAVRRFPHAYDIERGYAQVCYEMMAAGMMIDIPFINEKIAQIGAYAEGAMAWLRANHGVESVSSNDQVGAALNRAGIPTLAWTDGGKPAIDKDTMRVYWSAYPEQRELIQALQWSRKADSIINRCLRKFLHLAGPDAIVHYSIHSTGARQTGRSSVTGPPMQTYDRDEPVIRGAFIPRPGYVLVTIDADQIEMRETAHFSRDPRLIADFLEADRTGQSFFLIAASKIYGEQISKKDPRYSRTKNASYAQNFGAGLDKAAVTAGVTVEQMRPAYDGFRALYPGVQRLMQRLIREGRAMTRPAVPVLSGKLLYCWPGKEYALQNYLMQGSAAEILKSKAIELRAAGLGPYLRLPMHDELVFECPEAEARDVLAEAERILTDRENFAVPITWSGSVIEGDGGRWRKT